MTLISRATQDQNGGRSHGGDQLGFFRGGGLYSAVFINLGMDSGVLHRLFIPW